jgi:two-component sensor histidine kinase
MHVGILLWVMLINILVLYILGIRWGIGFLSASLLGYIYYIHVVFPITLEIIKDLPKATYYSVYYETLFAFFLLAYIIYTILKSSQDSDFLLKEKNDALIKQNNLISMRDEEKTIMLKEIHHRVKNNLQVITSLLRLQMAEIDSDNEKSTFKDSINRVLTMAKIHDKMYQSEELSKLNLEDYFEGLSTDLIDSYQINYGVDVKLDIRVEKIGLKTIVPLALIYNELFANSLKHAFEQTDSPEISVCIVHNNETHFTFTYADNGIWIDRAKETSFGLELIQSLTDQLDGEMEFSKAPETKFTFTFRHLDL